MTDDDDYPYKIRMLDIFPYQSDKYNEELGLVRRWLEETYNEPISNNGDRYAMLSKGFIGFKDETDAMAFKLRWL